MNIPILFIVFNRPHTTLKVFEQIAKAKPNKLYITADGPRENNKKDMEDCIEVRKIVSRIDWDCKVSKLFHDKNLGCGLSPITGINWFFKKEDMGIILEDDCLPDMSFFNFCEELLTKYKNDERIMMISGNNFQNGIKRGNSSYYFSKYTTTWGWATWKRAWKLFDMDLSSFSDFKENKLISNIFFNKSMEKYWFNIFQLVYDKKILFVWDYQWFFSVIINNGLCINPNVNMVSNIGFDENATHTKDKYSRMANLPSFSINDISHPKFILASKEADEFFFKKYCSVKKVSFIIRLKTILKKFLERLK
ncbi:MAG: nucleotide-diphospho-sugar transferase [Candidatus Humimicrobiaceae bacterium]